MKDIDEGAQIQSLKMNFCPPKFLQELNRSQNSKFSPTKEKSENPPFPEIESPRPQRSFRSSWFKLCSCVEEDNFNEVQEICLRPVGVPDVEDFNMQEISIQRGLYRSRISSGNFKPMGGNKLIKVPPKVVSPEILQNVSIQISSIEEGSIIKKGIKDQNIALNGQSTTPKFAGTTTLGLPGTTTLGPLGTYQSIPDQRNGSNPQTPIAESADHSRNNGQESSLFKRGSIRSKDPSPENKEKKKRAVLHEFLDAVHKEDASSNGGSRKSIVLKVEESIKKSGHSRPLKRP